MKKTIASIHKLLAQATNELCSLRDMLPPSTQQGRIREAIKHTDEAWQCVHEAKKALPDKV